MDERAGDEDAALFSGGHFTYQLIGEVKRLHALECLQGSSAHFICDVKIGPKR